MYISAYYAYVLCVANQSCLYNNFMKHEIGTDIYGVRNIAAARLSTKKCSENTV